MDFSVAFDLNWCVKEIGILAKNIGHRSDRHRIRHAGIRRQLTDHMSCFVMIGVKRLTDEHVSFTAAQLMVEVWCGKSSEFRLIGEFVRKGTECLPKSIEGMDIELFQTVQEMDLHPCELIHLR